jgi:hypothetical protein
MGVEGKGKDLFHPPFGFGQGRQGAEAPYQIGVLVAGQGVVEGEGQALAAALLQHLVPPGRIQPDHVEVIAVAPIGSIAGEQGGAIAIA